MMVLMDEVFNFVSLVFMYNFKGFDVEVNFIV